MSIVVNEKFKRVIVDVDCGMDDFLALMIFLHAEKLGTLKIEAITCSKGNTAVDNVLKTVARLLGAYKRKDIPVYRGCTTQLIKLEKEPEPYYGDDGFGDLAYDSDPDMSVVKDKHSAVAMHEIVKANPKEISLIMLGPLTNMAIAAKMYDDFKDNLREVWIMGGNYLGVGNTTSSAEWNIFLDPESAMMTLETMPCPITVLPWETSLKTVITYKWRYANLINPNNSALNLLNKAEKCQFGDKVEIWRPTDAILATAFIYPDQIIMKMTEYHASVELHGSQTRGQFVIDHLNSKPKNSIFVKEISVSAFKLLVLAAIKDNTPK